MNWSEFVKHLTGKDTAKVISAALKEVGDGVKSNTIVIMKVDDEEPKEVNTNTLEEMTKRIVLHWCLEWLLQGGVKFTEGEFEVMQDEVDAFIWAADIETLTVMMHHQ